MREVLIGDLAYVQVATVLQIMENEQLSGWLQTRVGTIVVRKGLIVDVEVDGLPAADAMMHLVDQESGGFIVEAGNPPRQEPLGTVPAMLMHAARLKDEWVRVRAEIYEVTAPLEGGLAGAERWFDGRRTVDEALRCGGMFVSECIDAINEAVLRGTLVRVAHADTPASASNAPGRELVHAGSDGE